MAKLSKDQITQYAKGAGFLGDDIDIAYAVAMAESGGDPTSHNQNSSTGDDSYGLWQINMIGDMGPSRRAQFGITSNSQLFDPATNARCAKIIKDGSGWNAWSTYKSGKYTQFLDKGTSAWKAAALGPLGVIADNKISDQYGGISSAINAVGANIMKAFTNITGIIIAIVFIILGVVLLARQEIVKATPVGKAIKAVKDVG